MLKQILFLGVIFHFLAVSAWGDELSILKKQIKKLENRLVILEEKGPITQSNISPELLEKIRNLEDEIVFLQEQQTSFMERLDQAINFNLYATLEFESFENKDSSFDARNIELFADARMTSRLRAFAEIEFERTAKTSSGSRQGEVEVEQGWLEYSIRNYFNPRFGVVLVPFGKFNLNHFDPFRDLTDRPIAMRRVVPTTWAEAGAGFVGDYYLGDKLGISFLDDLNINYKVFWINGLTNDLTDTSTRNARGSFGSDNNGNKALVGRLGIAPLAGQEIGLSGYLGEYDDTGKEMRGIDIDWEFNLGPLQLIGEYAFWDLEKGGFQSGSTSLLAPENMQGGYFQANYHFWFDSLSNSFLGESFDSPTFTAVLRYGQAEIDDDNDAGVGNNEENRWTLGLNYRPVETFVFKIEYQINETENEALERGSRDGFIASVTAAF